MPLIQYNLWANEYLSNVNPETQAKAFFAYRSMLSGIPLSAMYSGTSYIRVRDVMLTHNLVRRSTDYVPTTTFASTPRLFPMGEHVVFDIYTKQTYMRKGKLYTVQVNFDVFFPLGVIQKDNYDVQLYRLFFPIAELLFRRINVGASLESMTGSMDMQFTLGIVKREHDIIRNIGTWSIVITKYDESRVVSYVYDYIVKYRWEFRDLGGGTYNADMCHLRIARAVACNSGNDLYTLYNESYKKYTGRDKPYHEYTDIFTNCDFRFSYLRPVYTPLCRENLNTKILALL